MRYGVGYRIRYTFFEARPPERDKEKFEGQGIVVEIETVDTGNGKLSRYKVLPEFVNGAPYKMDRNKGWGRYHFILPVHVYAGERMSDEELLTSDRENLREEVLRGLRCQ